MTNLQFTPLTRKDKAVYWYLRLTCYMTGICPPIDWRTEWNLYLKTRRLFQSHD